MHSDRKAAGHIAKAAGVRALALDFRRSPEHKFPAQTDDVDRAYGWLLAQGHRPEHIVSSGHSIGGNFGPHNLHENRPGSFQSSTTIFATYQSAGLRVYDLADPFRPRESGWLVPPTPTVWKEPLRGRAKVRHSSDIFVAADGLCYLTDYDAGLYIAQWSGG